MPSIFRAQNVVLSSFLCGWRNGASGRQRTNWRGKFDGGCNWKGVIAIILHRISSWVPAASDAPCSFPIYGFVLLLILLYRSPSLLHGHYQSMEIDRKWKATGVARARCISIWFVFFFFFFFFLHEQCRSQEFFWRLLSIRSQCFDLDDLFFQLQNTNPLGDAIK